MSNEDFGSYFVQDVHSGYGPIEYTATPLEPFGPDARFSYYMRFEEKEYFGTVAPQCLSRTHSWDDYFYGVREDD